MKQYNLFDLPTQKELVGQTLKKLSAQEGEVIGVARAVRASLEADQNDYAGKVFGGSKTPDASVRRTIYSMEAQGLAVRNGRGMLQIKTEALKNVIIEGDAWEAINLIPDGAVSVIVADPPWTHLQKHRATGSTTRMTTNEYFQEKDIDAELLNGFWRVLKPGGYLCLYMPPIQETAHDIWINVLTEAKSAGGVGGAIGAQKAGFVLIREVTWKKSRSMGYRWTATTEPVLCFAKRNSDGSLPECMDKSITNFIEANAPRGLERTAYADWTQEKQDKWDDALKVYGSAAKIPREIKKVLPGKYHDTEKPVAVAEHLLKVAAKAGDLILEVFAGTGHACAAAVNLGMFYCAIEKSLRTARHCLAPRMAESLSDIIETN